MWVCAAVITSVANARRKQLPEPAPTLLLLAAEAIVAVVLEVPALAPTLLPNSVILRVHNLHIGRIGVPASLFVMVTPRGSAGTAAAMGVSVLELTVPKPPPEICMNVEHVVANVPFAQV